MTKIKLGINTGFAVNRFPEPEVWLKIVGKTLGLRYVQFTADLLNPALPDKIINYQINKILEYADKYNVKIDTTFTGAFTRVNHLMHPDKQIRNYWYEWFKKFFVISRKLGARASGSHFGILSVIDVNNKKRYKYLLDNAIKLWQKLGQFGKKIGFDFLIFEPMSIPREIGCTIKETRKILDRVNKNIAIPMLLCLDVDHGFEYSKNPEDNDPYAWILKLGKYSPVIHIKQSVKNKDGHKPFISEYNKEGRIIPLKIIETINKTGIDNVILLLEISHRERYPYDLRVIDDLVESVEYWHKWCS